MRLILTLEINKIDLKSQNMFAPEKKKHFRVLTEGCPCIKYLTFAVHQNMLKTDLNELEPQKTQLMAQ